MHLNYLQLLKRSINQQGAIVYIKQFGGFNVGKANDLSYSISISLRNITI